MSALPAITDLSCQQSIPTADTEAEVSMLMGYLVTHTNPTICYHVTDIVIHVNSNAAYLVPPTGKKKNSWILLPQ